VDPLEPHTAAGLDDLVEQLGVLRILIGCPASTATDILHLAAAHLRAAGDGRIVLVDDEQGRVGRLAGPLARQLSTSAVTVDAIIVRSCTVDGDVGDADLPGLARVAEFLATSPSHTTTATTYLVDGPRVSVIPNRMSPIVGGYAQSPGRHRTAATRRTNAVPRSF
jgi:hypothetical protein